MSDDYHDYVIKDGKFIGDFETMYQNCDNPWMQLEENANLYVKAMTCASIQKYHLDSIVELGCGLGKSTDYIKRNTGTQIIGVDISKTAIQKARRSYPDIEFVEQDVLQYIKGSEKCNYLFSEIMWYILQDLEDIVDSISRQGGYVLINQTFYPKGCQTYGTEYFSSVEEMIEYLPWKCVEKVVSYNEGSMDTHTVFYVE